VSGVGRREEELVVAIGTGYRRCMMHSPKAGCVSCIISTPRDAFCMCGAFH
jgi:hypothetical protein